MSAGRIRHVGRSTPAKTIRCGAPLLQAHGGRVTPPTREGYLLPTRLFGGDHLQVTLSGVAVELLYSPGETSDTVAVFLPDEHVLMSGDDFLRSFPNISPIRGARTRVPEEWIASLDRMIARQPVAVIPGHTRPVLGAEAAHDALMVQWQRHQPAAARRQGPGVAAGPPARRPRPGAGARARGAGCARREVGGRARRPGAGQRRRQRRREAD